MKARIIDVTSASEVKVISANAIVIVPTREFISLEKNEIGRMEGKKKHHHTGVYMQGGIINPGWSGNLTAEFLVVGELDFKVGEKIAHAIIEECDEEVIKYE